MRLPKGSGLVLGAALGLATISGCRGGGEGPRTGSTAAASEVQGVVREKGRDELKVSDANGREHTVKTNEETRVFVGGQATRGLDQIEEGSQVRASFTDKGENEPALRIEVLGSAQPASPEGQAPADGAAPRGQDGGSP
jgi:hypothetical protein